MHVPTASQVLIVDYSMEMNLHNKHKTLCTNNGFIFYVSRALSILHIRDFVVGITLVNDTCKYEHIITQMVAK